MSSLQNNTSFYLTTGLATLTGLTVMTLTGVVLLVRRVSQSVGLAAPTPEMLQEEKPEQNCPLIRHVPALTQTLAWRSLGAVSQTPVHLCTLPSRQDSDVKIVFLVKREDLISPIYGGNKVRTLQHQLAICQVRRDSGEKAFQQLVSVGTGGSNQVVATVVHAQALGWDKTRDGCSVNASWYEPDKADLDNTLNMLTVFSFQNVGFTYNWGEPKRVGRTLRALRDTWTQKDFVPLLLGGNCPSGVLGQVSAVLELAEQIVAGQSADPERIYLPVGSGCTISGLILGTVLVRYKGLEALSHPNFKIVGCNVHHDIAKFDRLFNLHVNPLFSFMPMTITHSVASACRALHELGGPNLEKECLEFIQNCVEMRSDADVVGKYGGHSPPTRQAAQHYDASGAVTDYQSGRPEKRLWVCGHFVGKALHPLLADLEVEASSSDKTPLIQQSPKYMLWMTKSAVQPRGPVDEWEKMKNQNEAVHKWANKGKAESTHRPGRVCTTDGSPEDYRSLMTTVTCKNN